MNGTGDGASTEKRTALQWQDPSSFIPSSSSGYPNPSAAPGNPGTWAGGRASRAFERQVGDVAMRPANPRPSAHGRYVPPSVVQQRRMVGRNSLDVSQLRVPAAHEHRSVGRATSSLTRPRS